MSTELNNMDEFREALRDLSVTYVFVNFIGNTDKYPKSQKQNEKYEEIAVECESEKDRKFYKAYLDNYEIRPEPYVSYRMGDWDEVYVVGFHTDNEEAVLYANTEDEEAFDQLFCYHA
ncbi:hypothetical protein BN7_2452 [Wickerhamomyces ciferrii]|uniref:Uncharacterized protein n=1 Tax=Wickerhamomyces ciferrii (strain ATCC 14091 / BCRC 22168 / CBS 111 / JCM 3599 / NBRC 0793 / NRRL Y-1031 F-60-10) TaxID=1206466 RepID=K0KIU2_WICCF|nr:uncharacterized protein BN7_2452 [Wickerhamomyces ciferrii]CCH42906.1 hypothetical protein BN7_2452 [Wickerhamomyces ciferrii]